MNTEKTINPPSGYAAFALFLLLLAVTIISLAFEAIAVGIPIGIIDFILYCPAW